MINKYSITIFLVIITYLVSFGQNSTIDLAFVTEEISKEVVTTEKKLNGETRKALTGLKLKATLWPNPSNIGKVRLSVENLPKQPLFIHIFNDKSELIQEGEIKGPEGTSLHQILILPDTSGTYSIKLSDASKIIKDLKLEIL